MSSFWKVNPKFFNHFFFSLEKKNRTGEKKKGSRLFNFQLIINTSKIFIFRSNPHNYELVKAPDLELIKRE